MSFSLAHILLATIAYLGTLFLVALLAERDLLPRGLIKHPALYVLSLGVFAGTMASNAVFELARDYGYGFLFYYSGTAVLFLFAPLLLMPMLRLCRLYQLSSLADLLAFRFRSQTVGTAVSAAMCLTVLPLLALQIEAVSDSVHLLAGGTAAVAKTERSEHWLALLFCVVITGFAILFGTRNSGPQQRNKGLVTVIAFESLIKLGALLLLMFAAVYQVFGGFDAMLDAVRQTPASTAMLQPPSDGNVSRMILLVFFCAAVCMPHMFHMTFTENRESLDMGAASWGLPLYLLLISLPVLPISWAVLALQQPYSAEQTPLALGLGLHSAPLAATAFVASLSAASATIIITTLALANMILNHLLLPGRLSRFQRKESLHDNLNWARRLLIALLIAAGYGCFLAADGSQSMAQLGLAAFSGTLQLVPGVVATLYWPRGNRYGLLAGIAGGLAIWFTTLLLPILGIPAPPWLLPLTLKIFGSGADTWAAATLLALGANALLFSVVSVITRPGKDEQVAAQLCAREDHYRPIRRTLALTSAGEFIASLATTLGGRMARSEVRRALMELHFDESENRPYALRRLRNRIEANLSGLLGPSVASRIVSQCIPFSTHAGDESQDLFLMEHRLDRPGIRLTGLSAELDSLRRHYRETLDNLPVGVFSIAADGEVLLWNRSMSTITGIPPTRVVGYLLESMPAPWGELFTSFLAGNPQAALRRKVELEGDHSCWISLHKTLSGAPDSGDRLVLVEDISELERLERELLHNERLASVGRLAAGVAHEIGNPITGIACLAQNLEYEADMEGVRDTAHDILKQTDRVSRIVESLVNFSHPGSASREACLLPCNVADCVDEAIHLLQLDTTTRVVDYRNHCDRELLVKADPQKLLQVFVNLLGNARDACASGAGIDIRANRDHDTVTIEVEDEGSGIAEPIQDRIFEPFFTTKDPGKGTGLGLALVHNMMEEMDGAISLVSPAREGDQPGTRFTLSLAVGQYELAGAKT